MFGLEVVAVVPFCLAAWRLSQKVSEQQLLIEQHEETITAQQEILEAILGPRPSVSTKMLVVCGLAAVGCVTTYFTMKVNRLRRGTVRPPPSYEPTAAQFEAEECSVCMNYRKDTVFAPCQHFCTCWPCSQRFVGKECPICREVVQSTQFTYVS